METATAVKPGAGVPSPSMRREDKRVTGSGTGSSDNDSLASEVGRLSEENAHLSRKLSEILGKAPATPTTSRSGSGLLSGNTGERMRDQVKKLERDNRRLQEQNSTLERRLVSGKVSATADELWRLKEENRGLKSDNAQLSSEIEQLNKVASYVGTRVAKVLVGARRANNYNSQLVGELKRWNRRLEDENHRLYAIIDRMQKSGGGSNDAAKEALSAMRDRGMDGNAKLVKQLEDQNVKLQEEISKLSDHAISLQNLSSSSGSSGSSGILAGPRTPSNHEQDGLRRGLNPDTEGRKVVEKLRDVKAERRKSRNFSVESLQSEPAEDNVERLRSENKKYAEEIERIGADLAFVRSQMTLSKELKDSNAQQTLEIKKLTEAAARVQALEDQNASQAVEIERLLDAQTKLEEEARVARELREDNAQMEEDIFKLADEVERLQPFAGKVAELEAQIAAFEEEIDSLKSDELARLKADNVEVQRTMEALAAEKAVLQAQVRELLEERAQLQSQNKELDIRTRQLQEKANESATLKAELTGLTQVRGQSATYRAQISSLRSENEQLSRKASDLAAQVASLQGRQVSRTALTMWAHSFSAAEAPAAERAAAAAQLPPAQFAEQVVAVSPTSSGGMVRGQRGGDEPPSGQLEKLRAENGALGAEIEGLRAECVALTAKVEGLEEAAASQPVAAAAAAEEHEAELEQLRAENRDLASQSAQSVLMTVELTTLRNQVTDLRRVEEQLEENQTALKQLRADKAALQKEVAELPALRAELTALQSQVSKAESAQKAAETALAGLSSTSLAKHNELYKQHREQGDELEKLQEQSRGVSEELSKREEELSRRDIQLASLQTEHNLLQQSHKELGLRSKQSVKDAESQTAALEFSVQQEKSRVAGVSREAAELHALLETAKAERRAQESALGELRDENSELVARISDLMARNEEHERTLESVLASRAHPSLSNGHAAAAAAAAPDAAAAASGRTASGLEAGIRPRTPAVVTENPTFVPNESPERVRTPVSPVFYNASEDEWRTPVTGSPLSQAASPRAAKQGPVAFPLPPSPRDGKLEVSKNGKSGKGFSSFFKLSGSKKAAAPAVITDEKAVRVPTVQAAPRADGRLGEQAEEQVVAMYERYVDSDDIDGFMAALGFSGFKGPTAPDDMEGAFASAKYACRPDVLKGASDWDLMVAQATFDLLEAWQGAWLQAMEE